MKIHEYNEMMSYLTRPAPKMQQAALVDELEPGPLKDELLKDFDPSQETYEEYLRRKALERQQSAQGGVIGKGGMFQGEDMGYRTGFKYIKKGYSESKFTNYADRNPGFEEFLKENNMSVEDFKKSYTKRDIIGKFERTQIPKKYITTSDLSKLLVEKGSPYTDSKNFSNLFNYAKRKLGKDPLENSKIKRAKKLIAIIDKELGIKRYSLKEIFQDFEGLSERPTKITEATGAFPNRYIKIDKNFDKKLSKIITALDGEFGKVGLKANTIDNIFSLYDDKKFMKELKNYTGGKVNPKSYLFKTAFQSGEKSYAFMQLGRILKGEIDLEGISPNKNTGNKIIKSMAFDSIGKKYGPMWNASYNYAKFQLSPYLNKNTNYDALAQTIKNAFKKAGVKNIDIDEIFPLRTGQFGVGKGSNAYSNFVQFIDSKINQGKKVAFDRNATTRYNEIIKANKAGNFDEVSNLVEKHNDAIKEFYKENPKAKGKVNLTQLRWDPKTNKFLSPKQVFGPEYKNIPEKIRQGMEKFYTKTGVSFDPKTTRTLESSTTVIKNLLSNADKPTIMRIRKALGCDLASGGRVGLATGSGNLLDCPMKKFAENPEGTLNKVGQAVPETRTPIINALKNLGSGTLKWGGRFFVGLTPILAGMEIADASKKYEEGVPSGQIAMDAFGNWVLPGAGTVYKDYQDRKMKKDIASPSELAAMEKEDDRRYYNMLQEDPLREADYSKKLEETQTTPEEELELFKLMEKQKAAEYFNQQRRKGERAEIAKQSTDTFSDFRDYAAATGGRVGFDKGSKPKDPSRRAFIKGITALAALPIVGKYFNLGKVLQRAKTYTGPAIDKVKGMPEWFPGLVKKLWNEGEDVTKKVAYTERQVVKRGTLESGDDVDLYYQMDTGNVSIEVTPKKGTYETGSGAYNREYSLDYRKGIGDESTKGTPPDEFGVIESRPVRTSKDDIELDWSDEMTVDEAMSDLTELEAFSKNKTTTQIHKKKGTKKKDVFPEYDPPEPDYDFD